MPNLRAVLDPEAFESLPETIDPRELFTERDGKYELALDGVKTIEDVRRLDQSLNAERRDHKATKSALSAFRKLLGDGDDASPEKLQQILDEYEEARTRLEAGEGKEIDEDTLKGLVDKKVAPLLRPVERERDTLKAQLAEAQEAIGKYAAREFARGFQDEVRLATSGDKGLKLQHDGVREDIELRSNLFERNDDGQYVTKDGVGVTPGLSVREWLIDEQQSGRRGHWFADSVSAGARPGRGGARDDGDNPWSDKGWNLTKQGQLVKADPERAVRLAKAAGKELQVAGLRR